MPCVSENTLLDYAGGRLSPERLHEVDLHVDGCDSCRTLLGDWLAGDSTLSQAQGPAQGLTPAMLPRGTPVGRYIVLKRLGAGGMGVVYTAYDPELDRTVCLKLLRTEVAGTVGEEEARARLLREAQAMARLSHANVVGVHDVGVFQGGVFVAMDYVQGTTLRDWNEERKRLWPEVLEVYIAAARGLHAAHQRGLVHRDFKPDNVLIGGEGVARVTDFGLVRPAAAAGGEGPPEPRAASPRGAPTPLETPLTVIGRVIGTPQYMSPEQLRGGAVDARSDQFSFCVALYQELYGERPFAGETMDDVLGEIEAGRVRAAPQGSAVPRWLRRALLKGLAADPARRHRDLEALLRVLTRDRVKGRLAVTAVAMAAVLAVATVAAWHFARGRPGRPFPAPRCLDAAPECLVEQTLLAAELLGERLGDDELAAAALTDLAVAADRRQDPTQAQRWAALASAKVDRIGSARLRERLLSRLAKLEPARSAR